MKLIIGKSFISKGPTIETVVCLSDSLLLKGKMSKPQKDFKHAIESKKFPCGRGEFSSTISMPIVALVRKTSSKTSLRSNGHKHKQEPSASFCINKLSFMYCDENAVPANKYRLITDSRPAARKVSSLAEFIRGCEACEFIH